jgi:adenosylhomocysteine nucleosidase
VHSFDLLAAIKSYTIGMSQICIITALPAESRVFIDALNLKPILDHGWRLYENSEYLLLQTGIGKLKAAAAVSAVLHTRQDIRVIVNAGITGGSTNIGDTFLAHQVTDQGSGEKWYPHLPPQRIVDSIPTSSIETLNRPSVEYQANTLFDMEAAGIMSAASNYLTTDAIQFIKVVSDNAQTPLASFNPAMITTLMQPTVPIVLNIGKWLSKTENAQTRSLSTRALHDEIIASIRHTATEKHQLLRLLQQHCALTGALPNTSQLLNKADASELIKTLRNTNTNLPFVYGDAH